jgi:hypothetical protein
MLLLAIIAIMVLLKLLLLLAIIVPDPKTLIASIALMVVC